MSEIGESSSNGRTNWNCAAFVNWTKMKSSKSHLFQREDDYSTSEKNIPQFEALTTLLFVLDTALLDEGDAIEASLTRCKYKYHQSCWLMLKYAKLERARKRKQHL